jgi:hypothetical protein
MTIVLLNKNTAPLVDNISSSKLILPTTLGILGLSIIVGGILYKQKHKLDKRDVVVCTQDISPIVYETASATYLEPTPLNRNKQLIYDGYLSINTHVVSAYDVGCESDYDFGCEPEYDMADNDNGIYQFAT